MRFLFVLWGIGPTAWLTKNLRYANYFASHKTPTGPSGRLNNTIVDGCMLLVKVLLWQRNEHNISVEQIKHVRTVVAYMLLMTFPRNANTVRSSTPRIPQSSLLLMLPSELQTSMRVGLCHKASLPCFDRCLISSSVTRLTPLSFKITSIHLLFDLSPYL